MALPGFEWFALSRVKVVLGSHGQPGWSYITDHRPASQRATWLLQAAVYQHQVSATEHASPDCGGCGGHPGCRELSSQLQVGACGWQLGSGAPLAQPTLQAHDLPGYAQN
jgi:hypothetical protein